MAVSEYDRIRSIGTHLVGVDLFRPVAAGEDVPDVITIRMPGQTDVVRVVRTATAPVRDADLSAFFDARETKALEAFEAWRANGVRFSFPKKQVIARIIQGIEEAVAMRRKSAMMQVEGALGIERRA
jgi:hypothetical protein